MTTWSRSSFPSSCRGTGWQHTLHNQTALVIKAALLFRKNTVVTDVPYLLKH